jgi:hypothetical protein
MQLKNIILDYKIMKYEGHYEFQTGVIELIILFFFLNLLTIKDIIKIIYNNNIAQDVTNNANANHIAKLSL